MPGNKKNSNSSPSPNNSCQYCDLKLLKCSKCKNVSYCSVDCQQKDWVNHKEVCKTQISEQSPSDPLLPNKEESCYNCGLFGVKLSKCSQCHEVAYCSKECQKEHWLEHKADCKKESNLPSGYSEKPKESCYNCGLFGVKLSKCSQCLEVVYCSKECQKEHWQKHKADCKKKSKVSSGVSETSKESCYNCGIFGDKLKKCAQCYEVTYCSKECQKKHWQKHKADCKKKSKVSSGVSETSKECCYNCGLFGVKLSKCSQCHEVAYCSKECQKEHWLEHKANCKMESNLPSGYFEPSSREQLSELPFGASRTSYSKCDHCFNTTRDGSNYCDVCFTFKVLDRNHSVPDAILYIASLRFPTSQVIRNYKDVNYLIERQVIVLHMKTKGIHPFRPSMVVRDHVGTDLILIFYLEDSGYPGFWAKFKPGNYICVKSPRFHHFLDFTTGFRIESLYDVSIIEDF